MPFPAFIRICFNKDYKKIYCDRVSKTADKSCEVELEQFCHHSLDTHHQYCINILLFYQFCVILSIFCYCLNFLFLPQYFVIASIFFYCFKIFLLLQYFFILIIFNCFVSF